MNHRTLKMIIDENLNRSAKPPQISATVIAKTDCNVLLLERSKFESLLNTQPAIVYYVMRGIVRHTHGIVRRMNTETAVMSNYIYKTKGRF